MSDEKNHWNAFYSGSGLWQIFDYVGDQIAKLDRGDDKSEDETAVNARLIAAAPAMLELLLELMDDKDGKQRECIWCDAPQGMGHASDCRLSAVLKSAKGE